MRLTFATRRSALALAQSRGFAQRLVARTSGLTVEELHVVTTGDKIAMQPLQDFGGKGLFVKELEEALLDGRADFAVHSMKDVPAEIAPNLAIVCIPEREDPRDAFLSNSGAPLSALPAGCRVGTTSLRRSVAIQLARPDLVVVPLRGNVDTRLRKLQEGEYDAIILALAGLKRLGLEERVTEILSPEVSLPAIGQGALGIECRADDRATRETVSVLADVPTTICLAAERAVLATVEGGCRTPVAAYAIRDGDELWIRGQLAEPDGSKPRSAARRIPWPEREAEAHAVGVDLGHELKRT